MQFQTTYHHFTQTLQNIYSKREAENIANLIFEEYTHTSKIQRLTQNINLTQEQEAKIQQALLQLLQNKPLQQILGYAWFYKNKFVVNENVLIPRPETEELVDLIIQENKKVTTPLHIIDIGTGSGCIPISLQLHLKNSVVASIDISTKAIEVAKQNATLHQANVTFMEQDFLDENLWENLPTYHIIVSNPPYISLQEKNEMHKNVLDYEPHLALFTPQNDYLIFYKKIAKLASTHLHKNGKVYCEINEHFASQTAEIFINKGFKATIVNDMQQKNRIVVAEHL